MDKLINDYSFGAWLWMWQIFLLLNIALVVWSIFCLIKSRKQNTSIKLLILISLFTFPIISSLIYLSDYYSKDVKDRML